MQLWSLGVNARMETGGQNESSCKCAGGGCRELRKGAEIRKSEGGYQRQALHLEMGCACLPQAVGKANVWPLTCRIVMVAIQAGGGHPELLSGSP